jgi:hypothetical protein
VGRRVLHADGTALSIHTAHAELAAVTDRWTELLEELHYTAGTGPAADAVRTRQAVVATNPTELSARWPAYADLTVCRVLRAVLALPIPTTTGNPFAVLTFYWRNVGPALLAEGALLAELAVPALADDGRALVHRLCTTSNPPRSHYQKAETAAKIVAAGLGIRTRDALALLRADAFRHNASILTSADAFLAARGLNLDPS